MQKVAETYSWRLKDKDVDIQIVQRFITATEIYLLVTDLSFLVTEDFFCWSIFNCF